MGSSQVHQGIDQGLSNYLVFGSLPAGPVDGRRSPARQVEAHPIKQFAIPVSLLVALIASAVLPSVAIAWAPAGQATVHPGVQVFTEGAQCTSNFVFEEGSEVFLGQAAHCPVWASEPA